MYDRILVPIDASRGTDRVADHALALADAFDAALSVLHVLEEIPEAPGREEAAGIVDGIADRAADAGTDVDTAIREGRPFEAIIEHAETVGADVIVMGTHGRSGVGRVLLGSVAERVVRRSPVPVLTVRLSAAAPGVADEATAVEIAEAALAEEGIENPAIVEDPYRTAGTWIVRAEGEEGTFNVHIDAATREARVAHIG